MSIAQIKGDLCTKKTLHDKSLKTWQFIKVCVERVWRIWQSCNMEQAKNKLRTSYNIAVPQDMVMQILWELDPEASVSGSVFCSDFCTLGTVYSAHVVTPTQPSATYCDTMCCIVTKCRPVALVSHDKIFFLIWKKFLNFGKIFGL